MSAIIPFRAGPALPPRAFEKLRRRAMFEVFKWDDVHGDEGLLCPFPILVSAAEWQSLARLAEALDAEAERAEAELLRRLDLHPALGMPAELAPLLAPASLAPARGAVRVTRFDFHPTPDGLRITESNCDVASGYIEASGFGAMMAEHYPSHELAGDPAGALAVRFLQACGEAATIGLLHLTTYSDDHQIMRYLTKRFSAAGLTPVHLGPEHIRSRCGVAFAETAWYRGPLDAVFRFMPAAWLPRLPLPADPALFFVGGRTQICNPGHALLIQSKRFPLVWDRLKTPLPTWRELLPETASPSDIDLSDPRWVIKPALGFEGADIAMDGVSPPAEIADVRRRAAESPGAWAAQRRFECLPIDTPSGPFFACLGVYVVGRRAAGAYARLARTPRIDAKAREACVLVERPS